MNGKHVLLIEDDLFYANILLEALRREGFDVAHAANGEEGMKLAKADRFDLILLDVVMPKMDGFQVLEALKSEPSTQNIFIVMLTKLSAKEDIQRCFQQGACEYIIKTQHSPDEIAARVKRILKLPAGFSVVELLVVLGVIAVAAVVAGVSWADYQAKQRDALRLSHLPQVRGALVAARQDGLLLTRCGDGLPVGSCWFCKDGECHRDNVTRDYLPLEWFSPDSSQLPVCRVDSRTPCDWAIERIGVVPPLSLDHFQIRFFLEKTHGNLKGGMTHVLHEDGSME